MFGFGRRDCFFRMDCFEAHSPNIAGWGPEEVLGPFFDVDAAWAMNGRRHAEMIII